MSFNRLTYDSCAYAKTLQESTDPLDYNLFKGKYESCKDCLDGSGVNNLAFGVKTDLESDLKGQTRLGSKCPSKQFPDNSQNGVPINTPASCQNIYYITPNNLPKIKNTGLKDINSYNQDICSFT
jgi:hypothetical protein